MGQSKKIENIKETVFDIDLGKICFSNQPNEFDKALFIVNDKILNQSVSNNKELQN